MVDAFQIVRANLPFLGSALLVTIELNIASIALALALGTAMGIGRVYGGRWIDRGLGFIIDVVRSIPILVIMVWVFFGLPLLLGVTDFPAFLAGVLALGIHSGAYIAEIVRGGLGSVRGGQLHAALALGMSRPQAIARIILPQAAIRMMPPLSTRIVRNIKDSVLASTIAVQELFWAANLLEGETAKPFPIYTTLMVFYFLAIVAIARALDRVYVKVAVRGAA
ncbi:MAG TPA: amino acid ABC transporter permease [Acetobacteraceae bacterium]|jgi:polar amino acid transport system permease protein|nr:amino acid ABC transporter permease [Acetobacteraceae bacterium]